MGQVGRTRRHAAAFAAVPAPAAEEPRGNRSTPRGSPAAGRMKTMTGALITRFDAQGPAGIAATLRDAPRDAPETPSTPHVGTPLGPRGRAPCARSSLNPRERTSGRRSRGLSDVLDGYPAISRTAALAPGAARRRDAASPVTGAPGAGCAMVVPPPRHHPGSTQSQFCRECVPRGGETGHVVEEPEAPAGRGRARG